MLRIIQVNISGIDMNLFLVFHAVLEERTTTRAAKRLGVTQSAVSNALARLRHTLGDPLFVRSGRGLVPTPRAEEMRPAVSEALRNLQVALGRSFEPASSDRAFTIACADHHQAADVPRLARAIARRLPKASLRVVSVDYLLSSDGFATGTVDVALAPEGLASPELHSAPLFEEAATLVVRRDHPTVGSSLKIAQLNALHHIDVHLALGQPGQVNRSVNSHLEALGLRRTIAIVVPSFTTAAMVAANTDYVAWLPDHAARLFTRILPLKPVKSPLPQLAIGCALVWHQRTHLDPACAFFRDIVLETLRERRKPASR